MADVLLIKNLNEDQLNSKSLIPVTFQTNISDKDKLVNIFNVLKATKHFTIKDCLCGPFLLP